MSDTSVVFSQILLGKEVICDLYGAATVVAIRYDVTHGYRLLLALKKGGDLIERDILSVSIPGFMQAEVPKSGPLEESTVYLTELPPTPRKP